MPWIKLVTTLKLLGENKRGKLIIYFGTWIFLDLCKKTWVFQVYTNKSIDVTILWIFSMIMQELEYNDPCEYLPAQDILWFYETKFE